MNSPSFFQILCFAQNFQMMGKTDAEEFFWIQFYRI